MITPMAYEAASATKRHAQNTLHVAAKLIAAVAGSSNRLVRVAAHPTVAALCLALAYVVPCGTYIFISVGVAQSPAVSGGKFHNPELLNGIIFLAAVGAAYFWFAFRLLKRIAVQRQHLGLIFQGVSDCLFLLQVEAGECYRFLCVNSAFLRVTGLTQEQVQGRRIEEVFPETSLALVKSQYQEAIRGRKTVSWEESV